MSTRILHISDLHFGSPFIEVVAQALLAVIPTLKPDAIVVSGDVSQRARRNEFEDARGFFNQLSDYPMLIVPGNHDVALWRVFERFFKPYGLYQKIICTDLNPVLQVGSVALVGLNSTAPRRSVSNGRLDRGQLKHSAEVFATVADDKVRIVVAHHQFVPGHDRIFDVAMPNATRAINCFVEQRVEMIMGGHLHRSYIGNSLDFFPGHHRDRGVIIVQCGTTTSGRGKGRERDENTFNVIDAGEQALSVTHYLYYENRANFLPISKHIFPRSGRPFDNGDISARSSVSGMAIRTVQKSSEN